jgi:Protein of unknown function (DUF1616)
VMESRRNIQWILVLLAAPAALLLCVFGHFAALIATGSLPLALFLPGYSLISAIDPSRSDFERMSVIVWAVVLSMAILVMGGLVLNVTSSLDRNSWAIYLAVVSSVFFVVACIRGFVRQRNVERPKHELQGRLGNRIVQWLGVLAVIALGLLVAGSRQSASKTSTLFAAAATGTNYNVAQCPQVDVTANVHISYRRDASGNYKILALGSVKNQSLDTLRNVVIIWVVKYADLSTGPATATPATQFEVGPGGSTNWGGLPSQTDGSVPPYAANIVSIVGAKNGLVCRDPATPS